MNSQRIVKCCEILIVLQSKLKHCQKIVDDVKHLPKSLKCRLLMCRIVFSNKSFSRKKIQVDKGLLANI